MAGQTRKLPPELIREALTPGVDAADLLQEHQFWSAQAAMQLAEEALANADTEREASVALVALSTQILDDCARVGESDAIDVRALLSYVQARLRVQAGEIVQAEDALRHAQTLWMRSGDSTWLARSNLGLSQVLTMQGRYAEAEDAIRSAIDFLQGTHMPEPLRLRSLATANRNLANVLMYQERHGSALDAYESVERYLSALMGSSGIGPNRDSDMQRELAHLALNRANALTFLDRPSEAESALLEAIDFFAQLEDWLNRGRAHTNLGRLYLREGRYAAALDQFDRSARDLIGDITVNESVDVSDLRQADELLLEHAVAYLSLNLHQEASGALQRCEALFRSGEQPFELARTRYTQGLLFLYASNHEACRKALDEALRLFRELQNRLWTNRTITALAAIDFQTGHSAEAMAALAELLTQSSQEELSADAIRWDLNSLSEARLLYAGILIDTGRISDAQRCLEQVGDDLGRFGAMEGRPGPVPHLYFRLEHLRGRCRQAIGEPEAAHSHFVHALTVMERQRASLPMEEIRTSFLDDKASIYGDLILNLLERADVAHANLGLAFDIAERARSRSLLERIQVTVEDDWGHDDAMDENLRYADLRREVHWHYNQLLQEPSRQHDAAFLERLRTIENSLEQMEWRALPMRQQAEPVNLEAFQQSLSVDEQAIVYTIVRNEVLAFRVDADSVHLYRNLCSADALHAALSDLRFQLGRAELGGEYLQRHESRLMSMLQGVLNRLYQMLVEPMRAELSSPNLCVIPFGALHLLPFHALWDGHKYLLEHFEFRYSPSASLVVHNRATDSQATAFTSFAGLALTDESIPGARNEVVAAGQHFDDVRLFLDTKASLSGLTQAASSAEILHIATHGLFRPDNSFFSALKLSDGWIDVREIYRLPLVAKLVVLSACESGAGEIRGADEVIGLARGFIGAGAKSLIVSLWNVHDASTADFMDWFYKRMGTGSSHAGPAASLRAAQLNAIDKQQHPYYWAPFVAVG